MISLLTKIVFVNIGFKNQIVFNFDKNYDTHYLLRNFDSYYVWYDVNLCLILLYKHKSTTHLYVVCIMYM